MERRSRKISVRRAGGNAGIRSLAYFVRIPNPWIDQMGITLDDRDVIITLDEENGRIIMKKVKNESTSSEI